MEWIKILPLIDLYAMENKNDKVFIMNKNIVIDSSTLNMDINLICKFLYYLKKITMTIHLDCYARTDCKPEVLSGVETGNRIPHDE